jgi:hypothetical protein
MSHLALDSQSLGSDEFPTFKTNDPILNPRASLTDPVDSNITTLCSIPRSIHNFLVLALRIPFSNIYNLYFRFIRTGVVD